VFSSALFCVDLADDRDVCLKVLSKLCCHLAPFYACFFCFAVSLVFWTPQTLTLLQVIKNSKDFFDQSLDEIKLLKLLQQHDPADCKNVLRLYDFFYFKVSSPPPPPFPIQSLPAALHLFLTLS